MWKLDITSLNSPENQTPSYKEESSFIAPWIDLDKSQKDELITKTNKMIGNNEEYRIVIQKLINKLLQNPEINKYDVIKYIDDESTFPAIINDAKNEKKENIESFFLWSYWYIERTIFKIGNTKRQELLKGNIANGNIGKELSENVAKIDDKYKNKTTAIENKDYKNFDTFSKIRPNEDIKEDFKAKLKNAWIPENDNRITTYTDNFLLMRYASENIRQEALAKPNEPLTEKQVKFVQNFNTLNTETFWLSETYEIQLPESQPFMIEQDWYNNFTAKEEDNSLTEISKNPIDAMQTLDKDNSFDKYVESELKQKTEEFKPFDELTDSEQNQYKDTYKGIAGKYYTTEIVTEEVKKYITFNARFFFGALNDEVSRPEQINQLASCFDSDWYFDENNFNELVNEDERNIKSDPNYKKLIKNADKRKDALSKIGNKVATTFIDKYRQEIENTKLKYITQKKVAVCVQALSNYLSTKTDVFQSVGWLKDTDPNSFSDNFSISAGGIEFQDNLMIINGTLPWWFPIKVKNDFTTWELRVSDTIHFDDETYFVNYFEPWNESNNRKKLNTTWPDIWQVEAIPNNSPMPVKFIIQS